MSRKVILRSWLMALTLVASMLSIQVVAAQTEGPDARPQISKWFVLRDGQNGNCRVKFLFPVHGHYMDRTGLKAGGPFDT